jgi:cardiolipin synthase
MASMQNHLPLYQNDSNVDYIASGERFYEVLFKKIKEAKNHIFIEVYILRYDLRGQELISLLKEKALQGLKIIVLIDGLGSASFSFFKKNLLNHTNIEFHINDPFLFPLFTTKITYRNHRKIFIIDDIAYIGGMNIGDEYDNTVPYYTHFKDGMIAIEGKALDSIFAIFKKDYAYITKKELDFDFKAKEVKSEMFMQVVESGPDALSPDIHDCYLGLMTRAEKSIKIMSPYLALDDEMMAALRLAIKEGVHVEIIIPGVPDKYLVYYITQYYVEKLVQMGAHIYTYVPGFLHTKCLLIDDEIASIGSYNLDNRSARIDFEITACFIGSSVKKIIRDFDETKAVSIKESIESLKKRPLIKRFLEHTLSLFSSLV